MGKFWQRRPDENGKMQLHAVANDAVRIDQPTLVYLSGFLTTNKRPDYVAGSLKRMEDLCIGHPAFPTLPQIYAWSHTNVGNVFNVAAYDLRPKTHASNVGYDVGRAVLMPLVTTKEGQPLPLDEAKRNVKNVTFFGYSSGSIVAQDTYNATLKMMQQSGYSEKNAREVLNEVALIAAGAICRPSKENNRFTTVYIVASNDRLMRFKNLVVGPVGVILRSLFGNYAKKKDKPLSIRPLSKTSVYVTASISPSLTATVFNQNRQIVGEKKIDPLYPECTGRRSYHELENLVTMDDKRSPMANIVMHAIVNALSRTEKPNPLRLLHPSEGTPIKDRISYRKKIADALRKPPKALAKKMEV